jgi:hypothetical protein
MENPHFQQENPRDHGLPSESVPVETPQVVCEVNKSCPHCQCSQTFGIKVRVHHPDIGEGWAWYRGCAACEWASAMPVLSDDTIFPFHNYESLD